MSYYLYRIRAWLWVPLKDVDVAGSEAEVERRQQESVRASMQQQRWESEQQWGGGSITNIDQQSQQQQSLKRKWEQAAPAPARTPPTEQPRTPAPANGDENDFEQMLDDM